MHKSIYFAPLWGGRGDRSIHAIEELAAAVGVVHPHAEFDISPAGLLHTEPGLKADLPAYIGRRRERLRQFRGLHGADLCRSPKDLAPAITLPSLARAEYAPRT